MFPIDDRALLRCLQDMWVDGIIMTCKLRWQALQHHSTVHHCADNYSHAWRYSAASCCRPLVGRVGRGYDPTGRGYARLRPNRMELHCRPLTTCQDRQDGVGYAPYTAFNALASV
jgi:hypothetical protein